MYVARNLFIYRAIIIATPIIIFSLRSMRLGYNQHFRSVSSNSMLKRLGCIPFGVSFKNKYSLFKVFYRGLDHVYLRLERFERYFSHHRAK